MAAIITSSFAFSVMIDGGEGVAIGILPVVPAVAGAAED